MLEQLLSMSKASIPDYPPSFDTSRGQLYPRDLDQDHKAKLAGEHSATVATQDKVTDAAKTNTMSSPPMVSSDPSEISPSKENDLYNYACQRFKSGELRFALAIYERCLRIRNSIGTGKSGITVHDLTIKAQLNKIAYLQGDYKKAKEGFEYLRDTITNDGNTGSKDWLPLLREVKRWLALSLVMLGRYQEARKELLHLFKEYIYGYSGSLTDELVFTTANLALVFALLGDYSNADDYYSQAETLERFLPEAPERHLEETPAVIRVTHATIQMLKGSYEIDAIRKAHHMSENALGTRHSSTLDAARLMAEILFFKGDYQEAEEVCQRALMAMRADEELGEGHPLTWKTEAALVPIFRAQARFVEAEYAALSVYKKFRRHFGDSHPQTIAVLAERAAVDVATGKLFTARKSLDAAYKAAAGAGALGENHPDTLKYGSDLALMLYQWGQFELAKNRALSVLAQQIKIYLPGLRLPSTEARDLCIEDMSAFILVLKDQQPGKVWPHPYILSTLQTIAKIQIRLKPNHLDVAQQILEGVSAIWTKNFGPSHLKTIDCRLELAVVHRKKGEPDQAKALLMELLSQITLKFGIEHPDTLSVQHELGVTACALSQWQQAESMQTEVLHLRFLLLGEMHPHAINSMLELSTCSTRRGELATAELIAQKALDIVKSSREYCLLDIHEAHKALAMAYLEQKRFSDAKRVLQELETILKENEILEGQLLFLEVQDGLAQVYQLEK
jgi:tetratricopeptide (TPR) repeat protein